MANISSGVGEVNDRYYEVLFNSEAMHVPLDDIDMGIMFESRKRYIEHCLEYGSNKIESQVKEVRMEGLQEMITLYGSDNAVDLYILKTMRRAYDAKIVSRMVKHLALKSNEVGDEEIQLECTLIAGMVFLQRKLALLVDMEVLLREFERNLVHITTNPKLVIIVLDCLLAVLMSSIHALEGINNTNIIADQAQDIIATTFMTRIKHMLALGGFERMILILKKKHIDNSIKMRAAELLFLCFNQVKSMSHLKDEFAKVYEKTASFLAKNMSSKYYKALTTIQTLQEAHQWAALFC